MAISDTITSMYENVGNVYDVLELAGADLTNVDKNIFNLKQSWEERLLYFLANGTDVVWNNWLPKVNGTGEGITLNNTIEAKMDFVYKGNTSQESTTGKNLLDVPSSYSFEGMKSKDITLSAGTYYITCGNITKGGANDPYIVITGVGGIALTQNLNRSFTISSEITKVSFYSNGYNWSESQGKTSTVENLMISTSESDYEPYTGGNPAPNPDYPYPVNVVTGDNEVKIFHTLFDKSTIQSGDIKNGNTNIRLCSRQNLWLEAGTYSFKTTMPLPYQYNIGVQNVGVPPLSNYPTYSYSSDWVSPTSNVFTFTLNTAGYFAIQFKKTPGNSELVANDIINYDFILEKGTSVNGQTYPINLGTMELCKIGDYQDYIAKSTGKNLVNSVETHHGINGTTGAITTENAYLGIEDYVSCKPNTTYTISFQHDIPTAQLYIGYKDESGTYLERVLIGTTRTFTTPNNAYYMFTYVYYSNSFSTIGGYVMLNEGSTALPYEPYGKVWCKYGAIGKVVLDGTQTPYYTVAQNDYYLFQISHTLFGFGNKNIYSNRFINALNWNVNIESLYVQTSGVYEILQGKILTSRLSEASVNGVKNWFSANNTDVYYVLATPTVTPITDTTLIYQLEAIKLSYNEQTNISQENDNLPFELDVVALGK